MPAPFLGSLPVTSIRADCLLFLLLIVQKSAARPPTRDHDDAMTVSWTLKLDYGVEVPLTLELL